jgi:D-alanine-D-alanine ligase
LDPHKYHVHVIFITKQGEWRLFHSPVNFLNHDAPESLDNSHFQKINLNFGTANALAQVTADIIFPVLHGANGEDGTLQGLLELISLPYVGPGVLSSAVCMDKDVAKRLARDANIPVAKWIVKQAQEAKLVNFEEIKNNLGLPFFVKPSCTGSSVGISKVKRAEDFKAAVDLALQFDHKILFEEFIPGREIECAVLGNENPEASLPSEIIPHHEFYSYDAKYIDPNGADVIVPADLPKDVIDKVQDLAKKAFKVLHCEGMARIDFFVTPNEIYLNEANTLPGFTQISGYPKMWIASGMTYSGLIDKLIDLALQRYERDRVLAKYKRP